MVQEEPGQTIAAGGYSLRQQSHQEAPYTYAQISHIHIYIHASIYPSIHTGTYVRRWV